MKTCNTRKLFTIAVILLNFAFACKDDTPGPSNPPPPPPGDTDGLSIPVKPASIPATIQHLMISDDYKVEAKVSGSDTYREVPVYKTDNYAVNQNSDRRPQIAASFANFSFTDGISIDVRITALKTSISSYKIRPISYNITSSQPSGSEITFTLTQHRKISIDINGRLNPLFIFGNPPEPAAETATGGGTTYTFQPGTVTDIGYRKVIHSNDRINIRAGAIVQGTFVLDRNATNVKFIGHGILTSGNVTYGANPNTHVVKNATFAGEGDFYSGVNYVTWQGLTIINAAGWVFGCTMGWEGDKHLSHHNIFKDLKQVHWNAQTDALWFDGDNNTVEDCFFFTNDDLTTHGSYNCTISNIVYWQGRNGGHLFMQDNWSSSSNITYNNVEVIGTDNQTVNMILVKATQSTTVTINNVTFKNINIEERPAPVGSYWKGRFLDMYLKAGSSANNWVFENIKIATQNADEGLLNPDGTITNLKFKDFYYGDTKMTSLGQAKITANANVTGVVFE